MNEPSAPALSAVGGAADHGRERDGEPKGSSGVHDEDNPSRTRGFHVLGVRPLNLGLCFFSPKVASSRPSVH